MMCVFVESKRTRARGIGEFRGHCHCDSDSFLLVRKYRCTETSPHGVVTADCEGRHGRVYQCLDKHIARLLCAVPIENRLSSLHCAENGCVVFLGYTGGSAPIHSTRCHSDPCY